MSIAAMTMKKTLVLARTRPMTLRQPKRSAWLSRATIRWPIIGADQHHARRSPAATSAPISTPSRLAISQSMTPCVGRMGSRLGVIGALVAGRRARRSSLAPPPLAASPGTRASRLRPTTAACAPRGRSMPSSGSRGSLLDRLDQRRVDVGLAAHRRGVAERFGDRLDHRLDADPRVLGLLQQLLEGDDAGAPGAEMLGGELAAASPRGCNR